MIGFRLAFPVEQVQSYVGSDASVPNSQYPACWTFRTNPPSQPVNVTSSIAGASGASFSADVFWNTGAGIDGIDIDHFVVYSFQQG